MTTLDAPSSYRRTQSGVLPPPPQVRRATVSSPVPSFTFSNTFESHRPRSRNYFERTSYPYRRSTVSGHSQGHNVNDAPQLTAHADEGMMWSDSASSSPIMSTVVLQDTSPAPSSSSCASPRLTHTAYEFPFSTSLHSPIDSSFTLGPSPEASSSMDHPRTMPPPPLLSAGFPIRSAPTATTTPALSSAASSASASASFALDPTPPGPPPSQSPHHHHHHHHQHTLSRDEHDSELNRLRDRVHHLEFINDLVRLRVAELESADSKARVHADLGLPVLSGPPDPSSAASSSAAAAPFGYINHDIGPLPADWDARTAARLRRFCALNRAGNALCAWHDSRRERRQHPPRMAPPETLNCGCTYAEALFEESLTRNGVGAFLPGENVRMDPALRNPLLRLLEQRYGYRDGDFERTANGGWRDGEDAGTWEQKAANSGRSNNRREHRQ